MVNLTEKANPYMRIEEHKKEQCRLQLKVLSFRVQQKLIPTLIG